MLLQNLGLTQKKIINSLKNKNTNKKIDNIKPYNLITKEDSKIIKVKSKSQKTIKLTEKIKLKSMLLGKIGRIKINKKLYKKTWWNNEEHIKVEDILGCLNYLQNKEHEFV